MRARGEKAPLLLSLSRGASSWGKTGWGKSRQMIGSGASSFLTQRRLHEFLTRFLVQRRMRVLDQVVPGRVLPKLRNSMRIRLSSASSTPTVPTEEEFLGNTHTREHSPREIPLLELANRTGRLLTLAPATLMTFLYCTWSTLPLASRRGEETRGRPRRRGRNEYCIVAYRRDSDQLRRLPCRVLTVVLLRRMFLPPPTLLVMLLLLLLLPPPPPLPAPLSLPPP